MKIIKIENTDLRVSKFIFGTASLFNAGSKSQRQHLLHSAVDAGFTHFDTAPYYGFGCAERDLAEILKAHPNITFTSKVGIYSPGGESQAEWMVFVRKAAGRVIGKISRPDIDFALSRAKSSLDDSLRRTRRDRIDIYMLHEPYFEMIDLPEWQRWFEECVTSGKIRYFGSASTIDKLEPFLSKKLDLGNVVQLSDSLRHDEANILRRSGTPVQITYGYLSSALRENPKSNVAHVLRAAVERNPTGAVIVSTRKSKRLPQFGRVLDEAE
jgi:D-threo-aldose 1-dehydrogenase